MIRTFADDDTRALFEEDDASPRRIPRDVWKRARMRLDSVNQAKEVDELRSPPSHRLEKLRGKRAGQWSIRINKQWRLCFRFEDGDAFDVEICDYH